MNGTPHGWRVTPLPPDWGTTRRRILTRDRHKCYLCGAHAPEVDHITPASQHGTDDDSNLAAICVRCHRRKTSAEGVAARAKPPRQRPPESHPGTLTEPHSTRQTDTQRLAPPSGPPPSTRPRRDNDRRVGDPPLPPPHEARSA